MNGKVFLIIGFAVFFLSLILGIAGFFYFPFVGIGTVESEQAVETLRTNSIRALLSYIAGTFGMVLGLVLIVIGGIKISNKKSDR